MSASLAIGDFSRATHLSIKTLRHYHDAGLLEPAEVDPQTGYRRYRTEQIAVAQVIRRFRDLDMPLPEIRAVLAAPDLQTRNALIAAHLGRLEGELARTQEAVASLRGLLQQPTLSANIGRRKLAAVRAAAISEVLDARDALTWLQGAQGELRATLAAQGLAPSGPPGGIYANSLFTEEHGEGTVFIPCEGAVRRVGRVVPFVAPAVELAVILHEGSYANVDRSYGALAAYVAQHALAVEGPIREYCIVGPLDTSDESAWRTEIGWPVFQTGP